MLTRALIAGVLTCASVSLSFAESGIASFYGGKAHHGKPMANGQIFNQESDSCAHKSHKFGTKLRVSYAGRSTVCVVHDRGPFIKGRIVDLSHRSARELGIMGRGIAPVTVEVIP